ncbi:carboxymethylenebutenolidase homolog isoform X2 [Eurytemora carolleeae]|nr:carboxymethylenebutenolidase homolog isoform X2 [Eurytemora carolleeae]|eukprot:XP_023330507.1 carboxymethylenebutenolidase homolog isoform X2 [Eurytemora affinis]
MDVYRVGNSRRCIVWCYDIYGFKGGRTRELCDKLSDKGYMVLLPDFFRGESRGLEDEDLISWVVTQSDWVGQRQFEWVENLLPYARSKGAEVFGAVGTCWGAYLVTKLSSYAEFKAGACFHPALTLVTELALQQNLYELLDEVQCPQLLITAGNDHDNEKKGGLANKVWGVMKFGIHCEYKEYKNMLHGWMVRGDMRNESISTDAKAAFNLLVSFLATNLK